MTVFRLTHWTHSLDPGISWNVQHSQTFLSTGHGKYTLVFNCSSFIPHLNDIAHSSPLLHYHTLYSSGSQNVAPGLPTSVQPRKLLRILGTGGMGGGWGRPRTCWMKLEVSPAICVVRVIQVTLMLTWLWEPLSKLFSESQYAPKVTLQMPNLLKRQFFHWMTNMSNGNLKIKKIKTCHIKQMHRFALPPTKAFNKFDLTGIKRIFNFMLLMMKYTTLCSEDLTLPSEKSAFALGFWGMISRPLDYPAW